MQIKIPNGEIEQKVKNTIKNTLCIFIAFFTSETNLCV